MLGHYGLGFGHLSEKEQDTYGHRTINDDSRAVSIGRTQVTSETAEDCALLLGAD